MTVIPTKLRDDAIVEALLQVRFAAAGELPEVVLGRLSDFDDGGDFRPTRLPLADIPTTVRRNDPNLNFQPLVELRGPNGQVVRVGDNVMSAHVVGIGMYPGWSVYQTQIERMLSDLFNKLKSVEIENISLRYINAIVAKRHHIASVHDLNLKVIVGDEQFRGPINLNFIEESGKGQSGHHVTTRIAHTSFVQGIIPPETVAVVDVEVSTLIGFRSRRIDEVLEWCESAHSLEKEAFFRLVPPQILPKLILE